MTKVAKSSAEARGAHKRTVKVLTIHQNFRTSAPMDARITEEVLNGAQTRVELLAVLKEAGFPLAERQRLASAIAKQRRESQAQPRAPHAPAPSQPPSSATTWIAWATGGSWQSARDSVSTVPVGWLERVIVIDDVLTRAECRCLIARAEAAGFEASQHQGRRDDEFRRGRRAALTDGGLAQELFHRIAPALLPLDALTEDVRECETGATGEGSRARAAAGVWEQLRILSYDSGDMFLPHRDNPCSVGGSSLLPKCRSLCSLLVYLSDSEDGGGATRFHFEDGSSEAAVCTEARPEASAVADVVPWAGRCVVFPHRMKHESLPITQGRKLVMRADVMWPV